MFKIPWSSKTLPHVVIEVNLMCNISCKNCYRQFQNLTKSLEEIQKELDIVKTHQNIQTVSLAGGEPTLHPDLPKIVSYVKKIGCRCVLISNGTKITASLLKQLKKAGLDLILFHIDGEQKRPDLNDHPTQDELNFLRSHLLKLSYDHGIDAGLSIILDKSQLGELVPLTEYFLGNSHASYMFITQRTDIDWMLQSSKELQNITDPLLQNRQRNILHDQMMTEKSTNEDCQKILFDHFSIHPFAYLPSEKDDGLEQKLQWMSYYFTTHTKNNKWTLLRFTSSFFDSLLLHLYHLIAKRFPFYTPQNRKVTLIRNLLNSLFTLNISSFVQTAKAIFSPSINVKSKYIAFDNGHYFNAQGKMSCVDFCPNPTVRDGKIVPSCVSDYQCHE